MVEKKPKEKQMLLSGKKPACLQDLRVVVIGSESSLSDDGFMLEVIEKMVSRFGVEKPIVIYSVVLHDKLEITDLNDFADIFFVEYNLEGIPSDGPHVIDALREKYERSYLVGWSRVVRRVRQEFIDAGANRVMSKTELESMKNLGKVFKLAYANYLENCPETEPV